MIIGKFKYTNSTSPQDNILMVANLCKYIRIYISVQ